MPTFGNLSVFDEIYDEGFWANGSGGGSALEACRPYMEFLQQFLDENNIQSLVDLGCGDWQFSQHLDFSVINYFGIDASRIIIEANQRKFQSDNVQFDVLRSYEDLPSADLLICKQVLQHLNPKEVEAIIAIAFPKYKHLLITNSMPPYSTLGRLFLRLKQKGRIINREIQTGDFTFLDITKPPYSIHGVKALTWWTDGPQGQAAASGSDKHSRGQIASSLKRFFSGKKAHELQETIWITNPG
jgi:SAM-dependent methyltransferase